MGEGRGEVVEDEGGVVVAGDGGREGIVVL